MYGTEIPATLLGGRVTSDVPPPSPVESSVREPYIPYIVAMLQAFDLLILRCF